MSEAKKLKVIGGIVMGSSIPFLFAVLLIMGVGSGLLDGNFPFLPEYEEGETSNIDWQELVQVIFLGFIPCIAIMLIGSHFFDKGDNLQYQERLDRLKIEFGEEGVAKIIKIMGKKK